ncbi:hypothetical protein Sango_2767300 [Sesamum angolense]|uniref:Uncharacterized protein n=1 Tax=Sesamum angolense TaxID=2727404 RepID=A0AAE1T9E5_9LAMI|nr:hypothetical protein Sango_2767300 [Sesamum angolense]
MVQAIAGSSRPHAAFAAHAAARRARAHPGSAACARVRCAPGHGRPASDMSQNPPNTILEANKFDGTNYFNWLRNLRIVLDFENQTYVLDKSLPWTLLEGFLPGERLTFEKFTQWPEYEKYEDVWSIMHRMKELYAVPDWHIRYTVTKALFGTRMIEGSSVREHGVMMLSLVERLKDLEADFKNKEAYVDVIRQSLSPSYDQFIINYNMNGLEKSLHELINMLVQYETTNEKSAPSVLVGEVSTSKARAKDAGREKRKKDETSSTAASISSVPVTPPGRGKGKRKRVKMRREKSKQESLLRLSDSRAVAAKTRDLVRLNGDHVRIVSM